MSIEAVGHEEDQSFATEYAATRWLVTHGWHDDERAADTGVRDVLRAVFVHTSTKRRGLLHQRKDGRWVLTIIMVGGQG
jgi:hypothetical protein